MIPTVTAQGEGGASAHKAVVFLHMRNCTFSMQCEQKDSMGSKEKVKVDRNLWSAWELIKAAPNALKKLARNIPRARHHMALLK